MLNKIKNKPFLYLKHKYFTELRCYLDGFAAGYSFPHVNSFFPSFQDYMESKYLCKLSYSWDNILLSITKDEEKAFDLFFKEFEIYLKENNIEIPDAQ